MLRVWTLFVMALASGASFPPESGLAAPAGSTVSPYSIITAGSYMPSLIANTSAVAAPVPVATTPAIVTVPPTMPPAVAAFVKKVKAAKADLSASMVPVV